MERGKRREMTKTEFLKELEKRLKYIPAEDRKDALDYYNEYLGEMNLLDTDDVAGVIETPKEVAGKIISECTEKHINEQTESKSVKNSATVVWLTVLGMLSLPLSLPLMIVAIALVLVMLILVASIVFAVFAVGIGLGIAGISCIATAFWAASFAQTITVIGVGLLSLAACLLIIIAGIYLIRFIAKLCVIAFGKKKGNK